MTSIKSLRLGNLIKVEIYNIVKYGKVLHPELEDQMFSISAMQVAPDLSEAQCYITAHPNKNKKAQSTPQLVKLLNSLSKQIMYEFAQKVNLRKVPRLKFRDFDTAPENIKLQDQYGL